VYWHSHDEYLCSSSVGDIANAFGLFLDRQRAIVLAEKTDLLPKWTWTPDFTLYCLQGGFQCYVETKGKWLNFDQSELGRFRAILQYLQACKPEIFNRLILVTRDEPWVIKGTKMEVVSIDDLSNKVQTLLG